jgi:hypothetical protein
MTPPSRRPAGLRVEQLEDRLAPAGARIPAGEFNWTQYSPTGELAQLIWDGTALVYRTRAASSWHEERIAVANTFTAAEYNSRDQVQKASQSAQLVFTADGTPHVLYLDPVWYGSSNSYQTIVRHFARVAGQWKLVESVSAPWLSDWGPSNLVAEAGPNNSLHILFAETYDYATGVGDAGSGLLWYATNKSGSWTFDRVANTADLRMDVWFAGGRWAPRFLSMAIDSRNHAHVTYTPQFYIAGAFSTVFSELKYATNASGSWRSETVMSPQDGTADAGLGASIAISPQGQVAIASYYVDRFPTGSPQTSKLMYHTRYSGGGWSHRDVATRPDGYVAGDGAHFTGFAPQLYFDSAGRPTIVFSDEAGEHLPVTFANEFAGQIRTARLVNGAWQLQTVYRQSDPIVNQLFYPIAAHYRGQTTFAGLQAFSHLDGNRNPIKTDFGLIEVGTPSGPSAPITAAPPAESPSAPSSGDVHLGRPSGVAGPKPASPTAMAAANEARDGVTSIVSVFRSDGSLDFSITPFGDGYTGGTRVVRADVTGDGVPDVIVASGGGIPSRIRIWDGQSRQLVHDNTPFEDFTGGLVIAAGDINGDRIADLVIGPDVGGGPRIQVWAGGTFQKLTPDFFGLPYPDFRGGLRLAAGDIDRDGIADVIVAPGVGGGPRLTIYNGRSFGSPEGPRTLVNDFFVFDENLRTGLFLAAGDINGDGHADIIAGSGVGGAPRVRVVSGADILAGQSDRSLADFFAVNVDERDGARVGVSSLDGDRRADVLVGTHRGWLSAYTGAALSGGLTDPLRSFQAIQVEDPIYVG